jgi:hypothetical protein
LGVPDVARRGGLFEIVAVGGVGGTAATPAPKAAAKNKKRR